MKQIQGLEFGGGQWKMFVLTDIPDENIQLLFELRFVLSKLINQPCVFFFKERYSAKSSF